MDLDKKLKRVSMTLSKILRHQAINMNIKIDDAGWVKLDDILKCNELKNISVADIEYIVEHNNKKRFALEIRNNITYIKANQGHSIDKVKDDLLLTELTKEHNIKYWNVKSSGGHFAPMEEPEVLIDEIRKFFNPYRSLI